MPLNNYPGKEKAKPGLDFAFKYAFSFLAYSLICSIVFWSINW